MELLLSKIPPVRQRNSDFRTCFENLIQQSEHLKIASGYISADALTEIKKIIEINKRPKLELLIGMHGFDGFTRTQYDAAKYLNDFLLKTNFGQVSIATTFRFHGKIYSFCKNNKPFAGIMGSSNLTNILDNHHVFETDILLKDKNIVTEIDNFIQLLNKKSAQPFSEWEPKKFIESNKLLEDHDRVEKCDMQTLSTIMANKTDVTFKIPLKSTPKSNLNVYFGKGRENARGFVKPRHWYEVELIVPKRITSEKNYPKAGYPQTESVITVYTDDGWKFNCKISGDYSKNFRSEDDLKILGKWMKGRLENNGSLKIGEPVTDEALKHYGRDHFELIATKDPKVWLLDFGAHK